MQLVDVLPNRIIENSPAGLECIPKRKELGMDIKAKKCIAGHAMTALNTYDRRKHGFNYKECKLCIREARLTRHRAGYTSDDQKRISKMDVIADDTSQITSCPKCAGLLTYGRGDHLEDAVSCVYCGWRPSARMEMEL